MAEVTHDAEMDAWYITIRPGAVVRTTEARRVVLLDLDENGDVLGIEIL